MSHSRPSWPAVSAELKPRHALSLFPRILHVLHIDFSCIRSHFARSLQRSSAARGLGATMSGKRQLPYYSEVQGFDLQQRRRLEEDPSRCRRRRRRRRLAAARTTFSLLCRMCLCGSLHSDQHIATCREKEAPKVWQAKEQTEFDEYDAITVRPALGPWCTCHSL